MPFLPKTRKELFNPTEIPANVVPLVAKKDKNIVRTKLKTGRPVGKEKLARLLSKKMKVPLAQANAFLDAYTRIVTAALTAGDKIILRDFGTLEVRQRSARNNRHPHTGKMMAVPAQNTVGFKASEHLKAAVANVRRTEKQQDAK